jgi:peroxiredoxin
VNLRFFGALSILLLLAGACSSSRAVNAAKEGRDRRQAPDFALTDISGKRVRLSDFKGKVVLLDFWATWCGPCKIEIPWFMEFQRKYKDKGFTVVGVSMDEGGWEVVRPFLDRLKVNYPVLLGTDDTAGNFGGVDVLPTTFIIDKDGRIVATHQGLTGKDEFEKAIESLL